MPKKSDAPAFVPGTTPAPILIAIASGDARLPSGLSLGHGPCLAEVLPDGRVVPQGLPKSILARYYPDLVAPATPTEADPQPPPPTIDEVA